MSCNSPNKVFYIGKNSDTGKKKILFTSRYVDYVYRRDVKDKWNLGTNGDPDSVFRQGYQVVTQSDLVPCGQCLGCRIDYSREWATRCMLEAKNYKKDELWFVTLTYDDDHLPEPIEVVDENTGEIFESKFHPLVKNHHTTFMKELRAHYGPGIRFFMCGEYGETTYRPHFHYLTFGLKLDDLVPFSKNWRGEIYYRSETLEKIWKKGFVTVGNLEYDSCAYVARYVCKKQKGKTSELYGKLGLVPEFCLMSRKPGIGKEYFDDNFDYIYSLDSITVPGYQKSITMQPPRYFDRLLEKCDLDKAEYIKSDRKRKAEKQVLTNKVIHPMIDEEDVFSTRERLLKNQVSILKKGEL